jgi:hypothetical protein
MISVHDDFKFILLAKFEDRKLFDAPLLNRFEKYEYSKEDSDSENESDVYYDSSDNSGSESE